MTKYEFTCIQSLNHLVMMEKANALGAEGWQMITTDRPHEFWIGIFQREKVEGADPVPTSFDHTGVGCFGIAGGDQDGRLVLPEDSPGDVIT